MLEKICMLLSIVVLVALLLTLPILWLWNWLMPLIGIIKINFWQALGLSLLISACRSGRLLKSPNSKD